MKNKIVLMAFLLVVAFTVSYGQDNERSKFGLGAALFNFSDFAFETGASPANTVYCTMNLSNSFRLEPNIAFVQSDGLDYVSLGIGVFGKKTVSKFDLLYGARFGLNSNETFFLAPTVGGEYYFIKNFSIGSEVSLKALINEGSAIYTSTSFLVRFYF